MAISWYNVAICIDRNRYPIEKYAYSGIFLRTNIPAGDCRVATLLAMTVVEVSWSHQVGNSGIGHGRRGHNPALRRHTEQCDKLKFAESATFRNRLRNVKKIDQKLTFLLATTRQAPMTEMVITAPQSITMPASPVSGAPSAVSSATEISEKVSSNWPRPPSSRQL